MNCPKCNEECHRDSVDVGVGVIHGPYGCPGCGWSENDQTEHESLEERRGFWDFIFSIGR